MYHKKHTPLYYAKVRLTLYKAIANEPLDAPLDDHQLAQICTNNNAIISISSTRKMRLSLGYPSIYKRKTLYKNQTDEQLKTMRKQQAEIIQNLEDALEREKKVQHLIEEMVIS